MEKRVADGQGNGWFGKEVGKGYMVWWITKSHSAWFGLRESCVWDRLGST